MSLKSYQRCPNELGSTQLTLQNTTSNSVTNNPKQWNTVCICKCTTSNHTRRMMGDVKCLDVESMEMPIQCCSIYNGCKTTIIIV